MSDGIWLMVALVGVMTIALRTIGPVLIGGRELPAALRRIVAYLAPAVLAALVATQVFTGSGHRLVIDARAAGLAAAAVALLFRAPILLVVAVAVLVTAVVRALG